MIRNYKRITLFLFGFAMISLLYRPLFAYDREFVVNEYAQIEGTPLAKEKLEELQYYLNKVVKFSDELTDYEAIGLLGNEDTVKFLKDFLQKNESNSTHIYKFFVRNYIFGSLVMLGERQYIDALTEGLTKNTPEYEEWLKKGVISGNDNWICSEVLRCLSVYRTSFDASHIDKMIETLNHPFHTVVYNIVYVLNKTFGILFTGEEPNWINQPTNVRLPYIKAWEKFWEQNKSRYGGDLPLIINDLELQAKFKTDKSLEIAIKNHGDKSLNILIEAPGELDEKNPNHFQQWLWVIGIIVDGDRKSPIMPRKYIHPCRILSPEEWKKIPDRPVHIEKITITPGDSYVYVMDITKAYPNAEFKGKKLCVEYRANTYRADPLGKIFRDEKIWEGELRSVMISN